MTALTGSEIRVLLEESDTAKRLIVAPLLEPDEQLRDEQASVDIRLGSYFSLMQPSTTGEIDEFSNNSIYDARNPSELKRLFRDYYKPLGDSLVIHPHQFILATTLEYLRLPSNVMAFVIGRSTWGRLGLIIATATAIHPLFTGTLTLELRNLGEMPLRLYPGQTIAQLVFNWVQQDQNETAVTGQYKGSIYPHPGKISSEMTRNKLSNLIELNSVSTPNLTK